MKIERTETEQRENPGFGPDWIWDLMIKIMFYLLIGVGILGVMTVILVILNPAPEVSMGVGDFLQAAVLSLIFFAIAALWNYWLCSGRWKRF